MIFLMKKKSNFLMMLYLKDIVKGLFKILKLSLIMFLKKFLGGILHVKGKHMNLQKKG